MEKEEMIKMNKERELELFEEAQKAANDAENKTSRLSAELERYRLSLKHDVATRTSEMQATLSLEMTESIIDDIDRTNRVLLTILMKSD